MKILIQDIKNRLKEYENRTAPAFPWSWLPIVSWAYVPPLWVSELQQLVMNLKQSQFLSNKDLHSFLQIVLDHKPTNNWDFTDPLNRLSNDIEGMMKQADVLELELFQLMKSRGLLNLESMEAVQSISSQNEKLRLRECLWAFDSGMSIDNFNKLLAYDQKFGKLCQPLANIGRTRNWEDFPGLLRSKNPEQYLEALAILRSNKVTECVPFSYLELTNDPIGMATACVTLKSAGWKLDMNNLGPVYRNPRHDDMAQAMIRLLARSLAADPENTELLAKSPLPLDMLQIMIDLNEMGILDKVNRSKLYTVAWDYSYQFWVTANLRKAGKLTVDFYNLCLKHQSSPRSFAAALAYLAENNLPEENIAFLYSCKDPQNAVKVAAILHEKGLLEDSTRELIKAADLPALYAVQFVLSNMKNLPFNMRNVSLILAAKEPKGVAEALKQLDGADIRDEASKDVVGMVNMPVETARSFIRLKEDGAYEEEISKRCKKMLDEKQNKMSSETKTLREAAKLLLFADTNKTPTTAPAEVRLERRHSSLN